MGHTTLCNWNWICVLSEPKIMHLRREDFVAMSSLCCDGSRWKNRYFSWWKTRSVCLEVVNVLVLFSRFHWFIFNLGKYLGQKSRKSRLIYLERSGIYIVRALIYI